MVIVMPGIYLAVARLLAQPKLARWVLPPFLALMLASAVLAYPFLPLPPLSL
jgi:hypothetical protein